MRRLSCQLGVLLGLLIVPALWRCAATSLHVVKVEAEINLRRHTILVAKDVQNGVGDFLSPEMPRDLPRKGRRV